MVGIPGKSKGCHTCRKRKVKCDLQRPDCQRCIQSGRVCEGYKRGAVFLNRTADGWQKRQRLEEAQPRDENTIILQTTPTSTQDTPTPALEPRVIHISDTTLRRRMFQMLFLENYLPSAPQYSQGTPGGWVTEAVYLNDLGFALEIALQALSITRVGRYTGHQDLIHRGRTAYGQALKALYTALGTPKLAGRDETLAAASVLALYELLESTTESTTQTTHAHHEHMLGIDRLVLYRGAGQAKSPLGKALMKNITYGAMVRCFQFRKASRFKSLIDYMEWWDMQGKLFAKGHDVGVLLEELDNYRNSGQHSLPESAEYLKKCVQRNAELEAWYDDLKKESPSSIFWVTSTDAPPGARLNFANILLAQLMQDYWAIKLIISSTISHICSQVPTEVPITFQKMLQQLNMAYGKEAQLALSTNIMESMAYCMRDEHGLSSSQKCLFSGRVALYSLRSSHREHLEKYEALFRDLSEKKGVRFANELTNQEMAKWTPVLAERKK